MADDGECVDALEGKEGEDDCEEEVKADADVTASVLGRTMQELQIVFISISWGKSLILDTRTSNLKKFNLKLCTSVCVFGGCVVFWM